MPLKLGRHSYVHGNAHGIINTFEAEVVVGNFTSIAKTLTVLGGIAEHPSALDPNMVSNYPFREMFLHHGKTVDYPPCGNRGPIIIGNDVWIGANVTLLDGTVIGDGAIIGAGAVVACKVPPYSVYTGNPARITKWRFPGNVIEKLLKIRWWDWPDEDIRKNMVLMQDVQAFVDVYGHKDE